MSKNYYDVLGVNKNSSQDEIKKAFRELSKKYHPDREGGDASKFKEINEAYSILGDADKRKKYDMESSGFNPFGSFFQSGGFNNFRQMASDVYANISISIEDAYFGCKSTVKVNGRTLSVDIPKGTPNGKLLRIPGMGQKGFNVYGQEATGDLIITVNIKDTDNMCLNSNGLLEVMVVVDWIDAILGAEMTIPIMDRNVKFRVPKYTQNGGWTIVGSQGFRKFKSDELGNLKVNFLIRMPKKLTDEQLRLLKNVKESLE